MKSRQEELIDRSLAAMVLVIEIYNKPEATPVVITNDPSAVKVTLAED